MKRLIPLVSFLAACAPFADRGPATTISEVQGSAHVSPFEGEVVEVEGVVTLALRDRRFSRFWIQSVTPDDDPATSEGLRIFIDDPDAELPAVGSLVRVEGRVEEYGRDGGLPSTELVDVRWNVVGQSELPPPVELDATRIPASIGGVGLEEPLSYSDDYLDFWESLEGMRVAIESPRVTGATSRWGDFVVLPGKAKVGTETWRGGALLAPHDENLAKIIIDTRGPTDRPRVRVGDSFRGDIVGLATYDFGSYRVIATSLPGDVQKSSVTRDRSPWGGGEELIVASYNVLNLSVVEPDRVRQVARSIVRDLRAPDLVGLQEIQDDSGSEDDGVVSASRTLEMLVEEIRREGGPRYEWRQIDPIDNADGGAPGGNIRNAFIFRPDRVSFVDRGTPAPDRETGLTNTNGVALTMSPGRLGTTTDCFLRSGADEEAEGTRKSLVAEIGFRDERYFVVNNHLKSKRGDDSVFGLRQPPQRITEVQRSCQTRLLARFARELLERDPGANLIVMGDLNEHEFRSPLEILEQAGLINLIETVPLERRYTYNYLGNSQVLDHILVSPSLGESEATVVHVNADFPDDARASDHDPVVARIRN